MKTSKFTEAQIAFILRQAEEGTPIAEVCRKAGISGEGWPLAADAGLQASSRGRMQAVAVTIGIIGRNEKTDSGVHVGADPEFLCRERSA